MNPSGLVLGLPSLHHGSFLLMEDLPPHEGRKPGSQGGFGRWQIDWGQEWRGMDLGIKHHINWACAALQGHQIDYIRVSGPRLKGL